MPGSRAPWFSNPLQVDRSVRTKTSACQFSVSFISISTPPSAMAFRRPYQRSDEGKSTGFGIQHQAFSSEWPLDFETRPTIGRTAVLATANGKYRSLNIDVITHFVIDDLKYEVVVEYTCTNRSTFFLHQRLGRSQRSRLLSWEEDRCLQGPIGKHPVISLRF